MKIKFFTVLVILCSFLNSCHAMNRDSARIRSTDYPADYAPVIEYIQLLVVQGYSPEQIFTHLRRINQPIDHKQLVRDPQFLANPDNTVNLLIPAILLLAVLGGVYLWARPYLIAREERAKAQVQDQIRAEAWAEFNRNVRQAGRQLGDDIAAVGNRIFGK